MGSCTVKTYVEVTMKKLIHDIHKGKDLSSNLKKYRDMAVPVYNEYASLELTFSAYTMVQEIVEEKEELAGQEKEVLNTILDSLRAMSEETVDYERLIPVMQRLREEITAKMDLFTAYTDRLIVYEYVMNRMELKFKPEKELNSQLASVDEEQFLKNLLIWIFSDKDQSVVRDKLSLVISQVPARMTKSKLFEKIGEALSLYKGGDRSSLDDFVYMIRTSAMLYEPAYQEGEYPQVEMGLRELEKTDFTTVGETRYDELVEILEESACYIHEITDFYYSLQKVVNGMYALCLSMPYGANDSGLIRACQSIWRCLAGKEYLDEMLVPLEGRIETYVEKTSYFESVFFEAKSSYQKEIAENELTGFFEDFVLVANLLSDSLFIDLDKVQKEEKADAAYVQKCTEELLDELSARMNEVTRPVKRAMTGLILEKLPMLIQSTEEVEDYIRVNLLGCQDKAEKLIVMSMLSDLMRE